jgi:hypothetical protein
MRLAERAETIYLCKNSDGLYGEEMGKLCTSAKREWDRSAYGVDSRTTHRNMAGK